jgi:hypothetical protein
MPFKSVQIALNASTATPLVVQGYTGTDFPNTTGVDGDEIPFLITNCDAVIVIYIGGPGVTTATGTPLAAGAALPIGVVGGGEIPYAIAASGTPTVAVLAGRQ